jgi:hypothetical protein
MQDSVQGHLNSSQCLSPRRTLCQSWVHPHGASAGLPQPAEGKGAPSALSDICAQHRAREAACIWAQTEIELVSMDSILCGAAGVDFGLKCGQLNLGRLRATKQDGTSNERRRLKQQTGRPAAAADSRLRHQPANMPCSITRHSPSAGVAGPGGHTS